MPHPPDLNVLIAEDNPFDRTILRRAFAAAGSHATLRFFDNGEDLLVFLRASVDEPAKKQGPAFVLLDMHMPRMNGKETLQHIRRDGRLKPLPVMILTTSDNEPHVHEMYELGANSYLVKPNNFDELVATVSGLEGFWFGAARLPKII
ncbi:response regulator [Lichenifustis flavocetrariae]|uniref:Response regulator n=1 Tax=Lichenifustis flavocetrariae TaxID=2949735 RepID=A0AA41Z0I3_9HYPH|nr:response regulator [Lichenifustis flavocetrariae]MCW6511931.1 response regulator [Lichenifustis flavocetrariae]